MRACAARTLAPYDTQSLMKAGAPASTREEKPASAREAKLALPPASFGNGETTLGGHVDRGLTLSALYDIGVLERLRLEVRVRILSDLAQSLAAPDSSSADSEYFIEHRNSPSERVRIGGQP